MPSSPRGVLTLVGLIAFLDEFALGVTAPLMSTMLQSRVIGATLFSVIASISSALGMLCSTALGRFSDLYGRRVAIVMSSTAMFLGNFCLLAESLSAARSGVIWLPAAGRILTTVGHSSIASPLNALFAAGHTASGLGSRGAASGVGKTLGAFGLGFAAGSAGGGLLSAHGSLPMALAAACSAVQLGVAVCLPVDAPAAMKTASANVRAAAERVGWLSVLREALREPHIRLLLLLTGLAGLSYHVYHGTSALYMKDAMGYSSAQFGYVLSFAGWVYALQALFVVPHFVGSTATSATLLRLSFGCTALGRIGLALAHDGPRLFEIPAATTICASYTILNLGQGMTATLLKALMINAAPHDRVGYLLGLAESCSALVGIVAPLGSGLLYDWLGPTAPVYFAGAISLGGCVAALFIKQPGLPAEDTAVQKKAA